MTWPAPDLLPPPPPADDPAIPEDDRERRARSGLPAATWIAVLGGALVLVAAASVIVANWDAIGRTFRVVGLVAGTIGLLYGSERLRQLAPTTANVVAHVGTFLSATIGIAALSLFGVTWPGCLVAGGALAVAATAMQAPRWSPQLFLAAQVAAIALAATGIAAMTGTSGGVVAALASLALLVAGAERRAAGLAVLAVLSPVLAALADAGIGAGTFERAGLVGGRLGWSGPTVGLLAAMVLGVVAHRRRSNGLMVAATAAPVLGLVTGLAAIDGSAVAWLTVPALLVVASELAWWMLPSERFRAPIAGTIDAIAATVGAASLLSPWIVAEVDFGTSLAHASAVPAIVTAFAMALATYRWYRADQRLADLGVPAVLALGLATLVALGAAPALSAPIAVAAVAAGAFASRRLHRAAVYVPAGWALAHVQPLVGTVWSGAWFVALALTTALFGIAVAARARPAVARPTGGWIEMGLVALVGAMFATVFAGGGAGHEATAGLVGVAVVGTMIALVERRWTGVFLASAAGVGALTTGAATTADGYAADGWIGWAAVAAGLTIVWLVHRTQLAAHAAASVAVLTATAFAAGRGVTVEDTVAGGMCAVALLTGLALTFQRRTPLDSAAITTGAVLMFAGGLPIDPAWVSGIWVVLGLQAVCYGFAMRHRLLTVAGAAVTAGAIASWWFTTGLDDWFRELIAPADITVGDLWMLVATVSALAIGWTLRRVGDLNSWLAYGAGLTTGGMWLVGAQLDRDPVWAIPTALSFGIVATGLGAWHRLAAPLVGGTIITLATTFVATGSDLTAIPVWVWLAAGGLALLGTAVMIERTSKQGTSLRDLVDRWG